MQVKNQNKEEFSERTDALAKKLNIPLRRLGKEMGLSTAILFACRNGTQPISSKTWSKLEQSEARAAGVLKDQIAPNSPTPLTASMREWLSFLRSCSQEALKLTGGDPDKAAPLFDRMLTLWSKYQDSSDADALAKLQELKSRAAGAPEAQRIQPPRAS